MHIDHRTDVPFATWQSLPGAGVRAGRVMVRDVKFDPGKHLYVDDDLFARLVV